MDECEFQRTLNLFPVILPRDYHADSVSSSQSTVQPAQNEQKEWQDAWDGADEKRSQFKKLNNMMHFGGN